MKRRAALLGLATAAAAAGAIGLGGCGSSSSPSATATAPAAASTPTTGTTTASAGQSYTMEVLNGKLATKYGVVSTADGIGHDTFMPSHMTVKAGVPVKITVYNYDEGPHTFTITDLNINEQIKAHVSNTQPSTTTFTVSFPKKGDYRFFCALPCDAGQRGWAMTPDRHGHGPSQDAFMAGYVSAI